MSEEQTPDFEFDPDKGAYLASFGPKGTGKSELSKRLFISYPYDGLLIDHTGDADPDYRWSEPLPPGLVAIARELDRWRVEKHTPSDEELEGAAQTIAEAWAPPNGPAFHKYRYTPAYLAPDWLEVTDSVIGLAYIHAHTAILLDEVNDAAPANRTPRFTRLSLRMGRHRQLSMLMPGPRPADIDPLVLSQPDVVTIHGQLHELDVARLARQFHTNDRELGSLVDGLAQYEFLAYFKATRELVIYPPLPSVRKEPRVPTTGRTSF